MAITPTSATLSAINSAISAAPSGSKRTAAASALSTDIGSGFRVVMKKAGVTKYDATFTGSLPVVGSSIVLSSVAATTVNTNAAMVRTGGDVVVSIEKASDATHAVSGSGGASGTDFILSADLDGSKSLSFTITLTFNSVADTTGVAPSQSDTRWRWLIDPRLSFSQIMARDPWTAYQINVNTQNDNGLDTISDPYWDPRAGDYRLMTVTDPVYGGSRKAYRMRTGANFTHRVDGTARSAFATPWSLTHDQVAQFGRTYWWGYAFKCETDTFASYVSPYEDDEAINVCDWHHTDNTTGSSQTPFCIFIGGNGYRIKRRWNPDDSGGSGGPQSEILHTDTSKDTTNWHWHVWKVKPHWDTTQSPRWTAWKAVGEGALTQIFDKSAANAYKNNDANLPLVAPKVGIYRWDVSAWGANNTRTLFIKGAGLIEDLPGTPTLDQHAMLAYMKQI